MHVLKPKVSHSLVIVYSTRTIQDLELICRCALLRTQSFYRTIAALHSLQEGKTQWAFGKTLFQSLMHTGMAFVDVLVFLRQEV